MFFNRGTLLAALVLIAGSGSALAQDVPQLQTNQAYVEDVTRCDRAERQ
jgi:hypothetical protein